MVASTGRSWEAELGEVLRRRTNAEWMERLAEVVPCGPVLALDEVFEDPQVQHLNLTRTVDHPARGSIEVLRLPLTFSDTPARIRSGPPENGAHTLEVLAELGYADTEIDALLAAGAVAAGAATNDAINNGTNRQEGEPPVVSTERPADIDTGTDKMLARVEGGIGWMTYNNPARLNAMSHEMQLAVPRILHAFAADPDVHVIVVRRR